jgi:HAD superfamily phosphoserine phosphatase-like hydrolase
MESNIEPINIFDFDGTLTTETWPKFWVWVKKFGYNGEKRNGKLEAALSDYRAIHKEDSLITFFGFFNDLLENNNETISIQELMEGEKNITYNPGVIDFLKNSIAKNYIVSGGLVEFLQNLEISKSIKGIYGTKVIFNEKGLISGIGEVMTDDKKILAIQDLLMINKRQQNDCQNVYYIGDGFSDAMAMKFVHNNGGKAIFVHQPQSNDKFFDYNKSVYEKLKSDGIVDYCCVADYRTDTTLFNILHRRS